MKLQLGKMKTKDLATWFGVSLGRFHNASAKFYEKLTNFCDYERVYGGVIIKEIYFDTYDKHFDAKVEKFIIDELMRCIEENDGLATISGMARLFVIEERFSSFSTAKRTLSKILTRLFGEIKEKGIYGEIGSREYVWGIKLDDYNHYCFMTEKESRLFDEIITDFYSRNPEIIKKAALFADAVNQGEMSAEDYFTIMNSKENEYLSFKKCIMDFNDRTNHIVARTTKYEIFKSYFELYVQKLNNAQN